ncbi:YceI family protein [Massilia sp. Root335]|uniref:YceI family protein n=1 Tax=Massilia sp. Root335 TaxID=1736517 RepID=UPI0007006C02|nr:YceI family protein [Massilia sp. Root335]KQV52515.1 polyisoprenoid-binding protein [Massilia sp. Root335]
MAVLTRTLIGALICAPIFTVQAAPVTYEIDATHTFVLLSRSNFGFSNPMIVANIDRGTLVFDHDDPSKSSVRVTLPVARINTFVPQLDTEFRSPMFFDIAKFPNITFESTRVKAIGNGKYTITGNLTAHGITRPVVLHARLNKAGENPMTKRQAIGFDATGTLKRSEFGLGFNIPNVSDEIALKLTMQGDATK